MEGMCRPDRPYPPGTAAKVTRPAQETAYPQLIGRMKDPISLALVLGCVCGSGEGVGGPGQGWGTGRERL